MWTKQLAIIVTLLLLILTACSPPESAAPEDGMADMEAGEMEGMEDAPLMDAMGDGLQVMDPFGRAAPAVAETGAFYMVISNGTETDEVLQSASIDLCGTVELHEMAMEGDMMRMQEVPGGEIVIPAGKAVTLEPGGLHVMCIDKDGELALGDMVPVTLNFLNAGTMTLDAEIREVAGGMQHGDMDNMDDMDDMEESESDS